jgi:hypothetical protein
MNVSPAVFALIVRIRKHGPENPQVMLSLPKASSGARAQA